MEYSNKNTYIKIPYGLRVHAVVAGTVKNTSNLDIKTTDKTHNIVKM